MNSVLFFGVFDPLHAGHAHAFVEAKGLGDYLIVVVARDSAIIHQKKRAPAIPEQERLAIVAANSSVDQAILGDEEVNSYNILATTPFHTLALGYDQQPSDAEVEALLQEKNLPHVRVVRLEAFQPENYKSSLLRSS